MQLISLSPTDARIDDFVTFKVRTEPHDRDAFVTCAKRLRHVVTVPDPGTEFLPFMLVDESEPVASLLLKFPTKDNTHLAEVDLTVHPEFRRRGIGTRLVDSALELVRERGRSTLVGMVTHPLDGDENWTDSGRPFAAATGFTAALAMTGLQADLAASEWRENELWEAEQAHWSEYEILHFTGPAPDDLVAGLAALTTRVNSDVPHGDLDVDEEAYDVERVRKQEAKENDQGITKLVAIARHRKTGRFGGYSTCRVHATIPDVANVGVTLVHPDHRGRRLGLALKTQIHRDLRRLHPRVTTIETGNAVDNEPMLDINRRLGFEPVGYATVFQTTVSPTPATGKAVS